MSDYNRLLDRITNVLEWGFTTGPIHPDNPTLENLTEQVFKVLRAEGVDVPLPPMTLDHERELRKAAETALAIEWRKGERSPGVDQHLDLARGVRELLAELARIRGVKPPATKETTA